MSQLLKELLKRVKHEDLLEFLADYAEKDSKFENAVNVRFRRPEYDAEIQKIAAEISSALDGASDYRHRDSWGYIDVDTGDIVSEIQLRAEQGHIRLAFSEAELLYRKLLEYFEYQEECEISDEAEGCLTLMAEIADKAVAEDDRNFIFNRCIELLDLDDGKDYGADYEDKLLAMAANLVTPQNLAVFETALSPFESAVNQWRAEAFKLIRLTVIRRIEGVAAADRFIARNLDFPAIREIAFDAAVSRKDYAEGERLCADALTTPDRRHTISPWLYRLYILYEMTGDTDKLAETAREILLCGDTSYFDKLKALLEARNIWRDAYPQLLQQCKQRLSYLGYMKILAAENEHARLLEQLKQNPKTVYSYGPSLAAEYPGDVCAIFTGEIRKEAQNAKGRAGYRRVCENIVLFDQAGYESETSELIDDFLVKYKRRPAFLDELRNISR